jgi:hypothetical protein
MEPETMNRKEFFSTAVEGGFACCAFGILDGLAPRVASAADSQTDQEKEFVKNWMADLFDSIDAVLDEPTKVKLMAGCGQGCYRRYSFKQDIARAGSGSPEKLLEAYKKNFEVWREGEFMHIRYGAENKQCYCPAARYHPAKPHDIHCECTRATHQTICETALGHPVDVRIVESLRRGGKTCHFLAKVG